MYNVDIEDIFCEGSTDEVDTNLQQNYSQPALSDIITPYVGSTPTTKNEELTLDFNIN